MELKAKVKELEMSKEMSPDFPKKLNIDPNRLAQILINLLSNALKYTNEGYVKVLCKVDNETN